MTDLSTWYTKQQACARLGNVSDRTIDRLVERRQVEKRTRPMPGRKPEPVYNPRDVDTLAQAAQVVTPSVIPPGVTALAKRGVEEVPEQLAGVLALLNRLAEISGRATPSTDRLWLTIAEASEYTGLSETLLRRLVREGRLAAVRDRAMKVRRADLASLDTVASLTGSSGEIARHV